MPNLKKYLIVLLIISMLLLDIAAINDLLTTKEGNPLIEYPILALTFTAFSISGILYIKDKQEKSKKPEEIVKGTFVQK